MTLNKPRIEIWAIDRIQPYELNAKKHDKVQVAKIAKSIQEFGWDQPIVVDADGVIIKGHGRRLAAIELGMSQVPVWIRDDLTAEQIRASRLADNRVAVGDLDHDILQQELASLDFDLSGFFDKKELDYLEADLATLNDDAFVASIDEEVEQQTAESSKKVEEVDSRPVKIDKALGFKTVEGRHERAIARFMAQIEADSGLPPGEAFVDFISRVMEPA